MTSIPARLAARLLAALVLAAPAAALGTPRVVLISLDGATPRIVEDLVERGVLPRDEGLALLARRGVSARQNVGVTPSLTAASHIAIATGASAARNDVPANAFHLLASPFGATIRAAPSISREGAMEGRSEMTNTREEFGRRERGSSATFT